MKSFIRDLVTTAVMAVVIFLILQVTVQVSVINGYSMEPNLHDGQRVVVSKVTYFFHQPERGDIIVFHPPANWNVVYIKRVIGLPGDTVEIRSGKVYINDNAQPLDEPYQLPASYSLSKAEVPADNYFVLGDNRDNSNDSHNGWMVPRQNIIGEAWLSIWPPQVWGLVPNYSFDEQMADANG